MVSMSPLQHLKAPKKPPLIATNFGSFQTPKFLTISLLVILNHHQKKEKGKMGKLIKTKGNKANSNSRKK